MIQAWSLHNDFTVDYRSDLVYDWYGIGSVCKELLMKCLVPLNLGNYKDIAKHGKRIISDIGYSVIVADSDYEGGVCVAGWPSSISVKEFLEEHEEVYIISEI